MGATLEAGPAQIPTGAGDGLVLRLFYGLGSIYRFGTSIILPSPIYGRPTEALIPFE